MELISSRRLTGPNLFWDSPGAVIDVELGPELVTGLVEAWRRSARFALDSVGLPASGLCHRSSARGVSLVMAAPIDVLYTACEINEWAFENAVAEIGNSPPKSPAEDLERLRKLMAEERNPALIALETACGEHGLPLLWDDEQVSAGYGHGAMVWPARSLPAPGAVPWQRLSSIPVGIITGTNGKTTSVRLAAIILRAAGFVTGLSSTDWIAVDDEVLDAGDYSGPGGARTVLRDSRVEAAVLETARGGLLRRGLAVERADAVLITNVASDHLGEFGVDSVEELARVKWTATRALGNGGKLILNADDPYLQALAAGSDAGIGWFSLDPNHQTLAGAASCCTVDRGQLLITESGRTDTLVAVEDIPITLGGAARHNIANAMGVVLFCRALGVARESIVDGLKTMASRHNPGRGNEFCVNGGRVIVDFAHNPHGMAAAMDIARLLPARRRLLIIGQAGDRSDQDIQGLARAAAAVDFDRVLIKEMPKYARGRQPGEVSGLLHAGFLECGVPADALEILDGEMDAIRAAVQWLAKDDLVLALIHEDRHTVLGFLAGHAGES